MEKENGFRTEKARQPGDSPGATKKQVEARGHTGQGSAERAMDRCVQRGRAKFSEIMISPGFWSVTKAHRATGDRILKTVGYGQ